MTKKLKFFVFLNLIFAVLILIKVHNIVPFSFVGVGFFIFLVLALIADYLSVENPIFGSVSISGAIEFATILLFGPLISIVISLLSYTIYFFTKEFKLKEDLYKWIFNISLFIITISLTGMAFFHLNGHLYIAQETSFVALIVSGFIYCIVNVTLNTLLISIIKQISVIKAFKINLGWALPNFVALIPMGYLLALIYSIGSIIGVILFFVPLLLARHTFKQYIDMRNMYLDTISSLSATIDAKDRYTLGHSFRVSQYAVAIAEELELSEKQVEVLKYIALLHDIGKIAVPEFILNKPGKLSDQEFKVMKYHSVFGSNIVKKIKFLQGEHIIRAHHERYDGTGYPDQLAGEDIPLQARIIAVADSFDAMTTNRPYRPAIPFEEAFEELRSCSNKQFDGKIVEAFIAVYPKITLEDAQLDEVMLPDDLLANIGNYGGGHTAL